MLHGAPAPVLINFTAALMNTCFHTYIDTNEESALTEHFFALS